jgi:N-acyl-D-amino-acid deacylase
MSAKDAAIASSVSTRAAESPRNPELFLDRQSAGAGAVARAARLAPARARGRDRFRGMRATDRRALAIVLAVLAVLAACSGRERANSPTPTASTLASPAPSTATAAPAASAAPAEPERAFTSDDVYSLEIRGGLVVDGSGRAARRADVLVKDGAIAFVGPVDASVRAERIIDAGDAVVAPGFIDAHAHVDPKGDVESELAQGVTAVVIGQDGASPARDIGAYLRSVDAARPRVEVATLVGHATLRAEAGVGAKLRPKSRERLAALADKAMKDGAFGLSTGLEYDAGKPATMEELVAIAEPVGRAGGVVMSHLRSEDDDKIEASLDELLEQCEKSGARAHVSHFK